jgi:MFS family permease
MLRDLPPNGRYAVILEPLWAVLGTSTIYYLAFYMKDTGLTAWQIGLVLSVNLWIAFFVQLITGTITDRMGRLRATLVFDVIAWTIPMLLWAVAQDFWVFLLAYVFNAWSRVPSVASRLLATEDAAPEDRPRVFAGIRLLLAVSGLVTPMIGLAMTRWGVQPTLRTMFVVGCCTMLGHALLRNRLMTETATGSAAMRAPRTGRVLTVAFRNLGTFLRRFPVLWPLILLVGLNSLAVQLNVFQVVYLVDRGFGTAQIALLPAIAAAAALPCLSLLRSRVPSGSLEKRVAIAAATSALGWLVFVAAPGVVLLVVSTALVTVGSVLMDAHLDVLSLGWLDERDRAEGMSALQTLTALVAIPSGSLAALVYTNGPALLFVLIALCHVGAAGLALVMRSRAGQSADEPSARTIG